MSKLSGDIIRHKLPTYIFGQNIFYTPQTGSTNTELKGYAQKGAPEGMLFITDEQLAGRGRLQRSWEAPAGSSLLMSLLFRPTFLKPAQIQQITMLCSLAMADAIKEHTGLVVNLKWPNDLVWNDGKKLAGILTESEFEGSTISWVVVGLGLNVNIDFNAYTEPEPNHLNRPASGHPPLAQTATSLSMILGEDATNLRLPILQSCLKNIEQRYDALRQGVSPHFEWQRKQMGMGHAVTVTVLKGAKQYTGTIIGVDKNGALRLKKEDGSKVTILAGDVTLR